MELKRILLAIALALLPASGQAQQTQSTINPNVPVPGTLVEQSGPLFRSNWQAAINDVNVLLGRTTGANVVKGDPSGVLDSQPAIVAAMAASPSVYFPPGTYLLNECLRIPSNITLWAVPGTVTIHIPATIDMSACVFGSTGHAVQNSIVGGGGNSNITISGIIFKGDGVSQTVATPITFVNVVNLTFDQNRVTNFGNVSIYNQGFNSFTITNPSINNNQFDNNSGDGLGINTSTGGTVSGNRAFSNGDYGIVGVGISQVAIVGNYAGNNTNVGIGLDNSSNVTVAGNTTTGNPVGINVAFVTGANSDITVSGNASNADTTAVQFSASTNSAVSGNVASGCAGICYHIVGTSGITLTGNTAIPAVAGTTNGIVFEADAGQNSTNNTMMGNTVVGGTFGIRELASGGGTIGSNVIVGNNVSGASTNYSTTNTPLSYASSLFTSGPTLFQSANNSLAAVFANTGGTANQRRFAWVPNGTSLLLQAFNDSNGFVRSILGVDFSGTTTFSGGVNLGSVPTSAGTGGLFLCVDTSGVIYKKSSCP